MLFDNIKLNYYIIENDIFLYLRHRNTSQEFKEIEDHKNW